MRKVGEIPREKPAGVGGGTTQRSVSGGRSRLTRNIDGVERRKYIMKNPNRSFLAILCGFFFLCAGMTAVAQKVQDPLKKKQEQTILPDRSKQRSRNVRDGIRADDFIPSNAIRVSQLVFTEPAA